MSGFSFRPLRSRSFPRLFFGLFAFSFVFCAVFPLFAAPSRVLCLAPNLTELVVSLGASDRLVAVTPFCSAPESIPRIRGGVIPEVEDVFAFSPDLILASPLTPPALRQQLARAGFHVEFFQTDSLRDIQSSLFRIARLLDLPPPLSPSLPSSVPTPSLSALLLFGTDAAFTAGKGTHANDILSFSGLRNVAAHASSPWPQLNEEVVLESDPDILIIADYSPLSKEEVLKILRAHPIRKHLSAVRNERVVVLPASAFSIPGVSALNAVDSLRSEIDTLFPTLRNTN